MSTINFIKTAGVPKITFGNGEEVSLSSTASVSADQTTNQLIISEYGQQRYYINAANTLQVEGATISGTLAQKKDLVAAAIAVSAGSGGTTPAVNQFTDQEAIILKQVISTFTQS